MSLSADEVPALRAIATRDPIARPLGPLAPPRRPPVQATRPSKPMAAPLDAALHLVRQHDGRWQLRSTRAEWAAAMLRGRPAGHAPMLLPGLYALCGGAHRLAALHALAAARGLANDAAGATARATVCAAAPGASPATAPGNDTAGTAADAQLLRLDTLREHLRRLWLDAPRVAAAGGGPIVAPAALDLAAAPFRHAATDLGDAATEAAARRWVETHVLHGDAEAWLAAWEADATTHAARWATTATTWPARWLGIVQNLLGDRAAPCQPLRAAASPAGLQALADALRTQAGFALAPTEHGQPAETGCWTRLADPHLAGRAGPADLADLAGAAASATARPLWLRHAARIAELAHLVAQGGAAWLAQGRFSPASAPSAFGGSTPSPAPAPPLREGLGWCEMARGLLVHWVRLDADDRIADYRVLAPTEWNFHPAGNAARALAACAGRTPSAVVDMAQLLATAAAYDPCVELRLQDRAEEPADA